LYCVGAESVQKHLGQGVASQRLTKHARNSARQGELGFPPGSHFARYSRQVHMAVFSVSLEGVGGLGGRVPTNGWGPDRISRRKILLLTGLATGLAVPAAAVLMASDAEAQQDTSAPPASPGAETAPKKKKQAKAKAKPKAAPSSTAPPSTQPKAQ